MRILIFSQHFPPETVATGRRASDLAESLANRGHEVTVLTGRPNHPSSLGLPFCRHAARHEYAAEGYQILRVPVFRSKDPRPLRRFLTYVTFMFSAAWWGIWQPRPDAVLAVSPLPTGLAALVARWWHRTLLVFDLQDIWPESALAVGVMGDRWTLGMLRHLERFFYRRCAIVVGITEGFKRYLVRLGLPPKRVAVIHNGAEWEKFLTARPDEKLWRAENLVGKFVVGYVGNIGLAQGLDTLLDAAELLRHEPVVFLLAGEGAEKQHLMARARVRSLDNVRFLNGVARQQVPSVLASCDALLVILRDHPLFRITIPSKLYEYMAADKPILCSVGGEAAALVAESGTGLPVRPSDAGALAHSVRLLLANRWRFRVQGEARPAWIRARFARTRVMNDYADLIEALPRRQSAPSARRYGSVT